jgi:hypothetical protein
MGPWDSVEQRRREYSAEEHKGLAFAESGLSIFVESCPQQAREIATVAPGRTVICPTSGEVHA